MKMYVSNKKIIFRIITIVLAISLILFAFIHSFMPAEISNEESGNVLGFLSSILNGLGINAELTDHIVRKLAHFTEYTAIGATLMCCCYTFNTKHPYKYIFTIGFIGLVSAVIDETIQLNIDGRSGQVTDILLDFSGVLTGMILMLLVLLIINYVRKRLRIRKGKMNG